MQRPATTRARIILAKIDNHLGIWKLFCVCCLGLLGLLAVAGAGAGAFLCSSALAAGGRRLEGMSKPHATNPVMSARVASAKVRIGNDEESYQTTWIFGRVLVERRWNSGMACIWFVLLDE
ncbi:hypothetical protein CGRA01v4_01197 [Colletotrichum graminicola]|nr:hypothetical protein CGRA01v4_01197 [Colletotrichum graminicola]